MYFSVGAPGIIIRARYRSPQPKWRNWQTRQVQDLVPVKGVEDRVLSSAIDKIMPTILNLRGWRVFFYSDEGNEPLHVHARKGDAECKFWLHQELFEIEEVWSQNLTPRLRREIRKIIYENFEVIAERWTRHFGES